MAAEGENFDPNLLVTPEQSPFVSDAAMIAERDHGHFFVKKTFGKPVYCHHCLEMLWGILSQGYVCEGKTTVKLKITKDL